MNLSCSQLTITDKVPLRSYRGGPPKTGRPLKYPVDQLMPGQSFFVPTERPEPVAICAYRYATRNGIKVATRTGVEQGMTGIRVWRVGQQGKAPLPLHGVPAITVPRTPAAPLAFSDYPDPKILRREIANLCQTRINSSILSDCTCPAHAQVLAVAARAKGINTRFNVVTVKGIRKMRVTRIC